MNDLRGEVKLGGMVLRLTMGGLREIWREMECKDFGALWDRLIEDNDVEALIVVCAKAAGMGPDEFVKKLDSLPEVVSCLDMSTAALELIGPLYMGLNWESASADETEADPTPAAEAATGG